MSLKEAPLDPVPGVAPRRARGRPRKPNIHADSSGLSREAIILKATQLAQTGPLDEISMVRLAREFGVVPGLIHYYVGSRDELLSGVLNHYFQARMANIPKPSGDWRNDVRAMARASRETMFQYPGVAQYIATHNRFRLFQKVGPGETDYGLEFFNAVAELLRCGGLSPRAAALGYHLLMQFTVTIVVGEITGLTPGRHDHYIRGKLAGLDATRYAGALHIADAFASLGFEESFDEGLEMLIAGIGRLD